MLNIMQKTEEEEKAPEAAAAEEKDETNVQVTFPAHDLTLLHLFPRGCNKRTLLLIVYPQILT